MASLENFETLLKEVVQSKRLSASKMSKLTDIALQSMETDTQLVSILYRTHKSLPTAAKVSSLYVFDALARASRHRVTKQGLTGDKSEKGNCATFLLKIEGVLDGLFQDMIVTGTPESKEKSKKVLDIWAKASTFPSAVLKRLKEVVKEAEKEPDKVNPETISDLPADNGQTTSMMTPMPPAPVAKSPPPIPADSVQSTLLTLLSRAAATGGGGPNGQTGSNTGTLPPQPQLDLSQLALLQQQLTQTTKQGNGLASQPIPLPLSFVPPSAPQSVPTESIGPQHATLYRFGAGRRDPRFDGYGSPDRGRGRDDYYDDRPRGGYHGGFRGRGRGDGRGRWDDRDRYSRDGDWSPPQRGGRSRSRSPHNPRSPRRYGARRDIKPYSPPRRPSMAPLAAKEQSNSAEPELPAAALPDKDEFGRDIRPPSPANPAPAAQLQSVESTSIPANNQISVSEKKPPGAAINTQWTEQSKAVELEKFDVTTADFSSPSSWEALATLWQANYGYFPSTEELMAFVMSRGMGGSDVHSQSNVPRVSDPDWVHQDTSVEQAWQRHGGRGRGGGRGGHSRGGHDYNNTGSQRGYISTGHERHDSDAIVLGGGSSEADEDTNQLRPSTETGIQNSTQDEGQGSTGGGLGGRMQRVGDKWIFVRDPPSVVIP